MWLPVSKSNLTELVSIDLNSFGSFMLTNFFGLLISYLIIYIYIILCFILLYYREITRHLVEEGGADIFLTANYGQTPYACAAPKKHHSAERQKEQGKVMEYLDRKMKEKR